ncbi:MAG: AEC family transporter [Paracoccaceae bacterium]
MGILIDVVLPVFLVIGFGYAAAWFGLLSEASVDALMGFAIRFAIPSLLFLAISRIDLAADFSAPLLASFFIGAFTAFVLGYLGARHLFARSSEDAISIGFCALFSNTVLLGLPITERAYGTGSGALAGAFTIVSLHALIIYAFGVTLMEVARSRNSGIGPGLIRKILRAMSGNPILIGIALGFIANLTNIWLPKSLLTGLGILAGAALPAALFGLGGVLVRYRPEGDMKTIAWVTGLSLIVHPGVTYITGRWVFALEEPQFRAAVLMAAMAPGINAFLFASMYNTAKRVAASSVLIATGLSIFTVWVWLAILP